MNWLQFSKISGCLKAIVYNAPIPGILQGDTYRVGNNLYAFVAQPSLSGGKWSEKTECLWNGVSLEIHSGHN